MRWIRDELDDNTTDFKSFEFFYRFTDNTVADGTVNEEIDVSLKYFGNFLRNI